MRTALKFLAGTGMTAGVFACLALLEWRQEIRDSACPIEPAFEVGLQKFMEAPHAVQVGDFVLDWEADCVFVMKAKVGELNGTAGSITPRELDLVYDRATRHWNASEPRP